MKLKFTSSISGLSLFLILLISLTGFKSPENKNANLVSGGELNFTIRTVSEGGNYAPKHVLAIWIEYDNAFVKTRLRKANQRKQYLYTWKAITTAAGSPYNVVDAITGSTINGHTTHTVSWDCTDLEGNIVPDGEYTVWVEFTEKHAQGPLYSLSFTKGPDTQLFTPSDETYFKDIELEFNPYTAEFISNTTETCQNEELTFTDESVNASDWDWDFGNGASPTSANTEGPHTVFYSTPGLKTVSLTINGSLTETKENFIEVITSPVAGFEFSGADLSVDFINNSTDAESYLWDFGDGNSSTEENPIHTYSVEGSYMVVLEAINSICSNEITNEVQVPIVGIQEIPDSDFITISPNPNNGSFTVDISEFGKVSGYNILDMTGREVRFISNGNQSTIAFNMENKKAGIYFIQFTSNKKVYSKKFVVR